MSYPTAPSYDPDHEVTVTAMDWDHMEVGAARCSCGASWERPPGEDVVYTIVVWDEAHRQEGSS
jgi:hypothetical protein